MCLYWGIVCKCFESLCGVFLCLYVFIWRVGLLGRELKWKFVGVCIGGSVKSLKYGRVFGVCGYWCGFV